MNGVLEDLITKDLSVVFCGTAVGNASAKRRAYYAGRGNAFWGTLYEIGMTPTLFVPEEYTSVKELGLGFTDLAKLIAGNDKVLRNQHFDVDGLTQKIRKYKPRFLAFTSKRAAKEFLGKRVEYGLLPDEIGQTSLFVLPSPSGAARAYWNIDYWHKLAGLAKTG